MADTVFDRFLADFGVPRSVLTYVSWPTKFDSRRTEAALEATDIRVPPLSSYADKLWDYWERHLDPDLFRDRTLLGAVRGRMGFGSGVAKIAEQQIPDELLRLGRRVQGSVSLEKSVRGRVVMVTGASSGIGKAAAMKIAEAGGMVLLVARTPEKLETTKEAIEDAGGVAYIHRCDLSDMEDIDRMADEVLMQHGHVDILVNNAGRSIRRSIALSYDRFHDFERTIQLNYFGAVRLILKLLPSMRQRRAGHIINISSIGVQTNPPRFSAYVGSKAALDAFSRCVSSEVLDDGVAFTSIYMPLVRTPMIGPTKMYDRFPTLTPDEAGDMICEAIIHKPKRIATPLGTLGQILYAINPKSVDYILNTAYHTFPDSTAAKGEEAKEGEGAAGFGPAPRHRTGAGLGPALQPAGGVRVPDARDPLVATGERRKHWGWGPESAQLTREQLEAAAAQVRERLGFGGEEIREPVPLEEIELREPRVAPPASLEGICSLDRYERASHALGKAYRDVVRGFRGEFPNPPDVVARPREEADVERVLAWCADASLAAIPYGGGSSVVGGIEPRVSGDYAGAVTIDLGALDRVLEVDETSRAARIQAGALGPDLEDQLRPHGLTLRHFPQSFEFSTLGGWIATRAGGHFATRLTHIDDLVESVRAITPAGEWESRRLPGSGAGPSPDRALIGSEGILGVITEAWVRLQARPVHKLSCGVEFDDFGAGAAAVRELSQSGLDPSNCRLLDATEAEVTGAGPAGKALLVLGFESAHHPVEHWMDLALEAAREHGGEPGEVRGAGDRSGDAVSSWRSAFLGAPYLRDTFIALGVLSDTFETAITWDRFEEFHATVMEAAGRAVAGGLRRGAGRAGLAAPLLPLHPRLPRRARALLHGAGAREAGRRGRAVGRDQGGGLGGADRRRRHDHPSPRRRARPPALV